MAESKFKALLIGFFGFSLLIIMFGSCSGDDSYNVSVTQVIAAEKGLDLKAVGEILKNSPDAKSFEEKLNDPAVGVNNLDLNGDKKVDYIKVTEFGDEKTKGFSLTTEVAAGEEQEIATIKIQKQGEEKANVELHGNSSIYGQNHYRHSSWGGMGTGLMLGYLWGAHRPYYSPYGWGSYPGSYRSYGTSSYSDYSRRTTNMTKDKGYSSSKVSRVGQGVTSPNRGKSARSIKAGLKNPTASQKSFQSRNRARSVRSGGFGRSSSVRGGRSFGGK